MVANYTSGQPMEMVTKTEGCTMMLQSSKRFELQPCVREVHDSATCEAGDVEILRNALQDGRCAEAGDTRVGGREARDAGDAGRLLGRWSQSDDSLVQQVNPTGMSCLQGLGGLVTAKLNYPPNCQV